MPHVPGLRSPYVQVGRLVYFGRMLDKIRLHAAGQLPSDYHANLGRGFDERTCRFLGVEYARMQARVLAGGADEEILGWAEQSGRRPDDRECRIWNAFMMKLGWRDEATPTLRRRAESQRLAHCPIETFFDLIEYDEDRDPVRSESWLLRPAQAVIVMGVSGSGKSTIGKGLAEVLGWRFADADAFHPDANIAKMQQGQPLNDDDRAPWLAALRHHLISLLHEGVSCVLACSALKERYRAVLQFDPARVQVLYLRGTREILQERIQARTGHFMPATLLDSQLATLEEPASPPAIVLDVAETPARLITRAAEALRSPAAAPGGSSAPSS